MAYSEPCKLPTRRSQLFLIQASPHGRLSVLTTWQLISLKAIHPRDQSGKSHIFCDLTSGSCIIISIAFNGSQPSADCEGESIGLLITGDSFISNPWEATISGNVLWAFHSPKCAFYVIVIFTIPSGACEMISRERIYWLVHFASQSWKNSFSIILE